MTWQNCLFQLVSAVRCLRYRWYRVVCEKREIIKHLARNSAMSVVKGAEVDLCDLDVGMLMQDAAL